MRTDAVPLKPILVFSALACLVPALVAVRVAFFSGCSKPKGFHDDLSIAGHEGVDTIKFLPGNWEEDESQAPDPFQPFTGGDPAGAFFEDPGANPAGGQGLVESSMFGALEGNGFPSGADGYSYSGTWGWRGWDYRSYYSWLSRYYRYYWKKYQASGKRKWLVPDSPGSYYVTMPGGFGLYDEGSGSWRWESDTDEDEAAAGEPVTTPSSVNVVFASPKEAFLTGSPLVLKSFDRYAGGELFSTTLPPGTRDVSVSEDEGVITVEICYGDPAPCDTHTFEI
jgi:hypothetical protein